jgi:hypothetical protein
MAKTMYTWIYVILGLLQASILLCYKIDAITYLKLIHQLTLLKDQNPEMAGNIKFSLYIRMQFHCVSLL